MALSSWSVGGLRRTVWVGSRSSAPESVPPSCDDPVHQAPQVLNTGPAGHDTEPPPAVEGRQNLTPRVEARGDRSIRSHNVDCRHHRGVRPGKIAVGYLVDILELQPMVRVAGGTPRFRTPADGALPVDPDGDCRVWAWTRFHDRHNSRGGHGIRARNDVGGPPGRRCVDGSPGD